MVCQKPYWSQYRRRNTSSPSDIAMIILLVKNSSSFVNVDKQEQQKSPDGKTTGQIHHPHGANMDPGEQLKNETIWKGGRE